MFFIIKRYCFYFKCQSSHHSEYYVNYVYVHIYIYIYIYIYLYINKQVFYPLFFFYNIAETDDEEQDVQIVELKRNKSHKENDRYNSGVAFTAIIRNLMQ